jgi:hypothetical protein
MSWKWGHQQRHQHQMGPSTTKWGHRQGRLHQRVVRHHLILGGLPEECLNIIAGFLDIASYTTPSLFCDANLVVVLKNDCKPHLNVRKQYNVDHAFHHMLRD